MSFAAEQTRPTVCVNCGEKWPHDPALLVDCPSCPALAGHPCKTPSGHTKMGIHVGRDQRALDEGKILPCPGRKRGHGYDAARPDLKPGDEIRITWPGITPPEKRAKFVRWTRTGSVVVNVATGDPKRPWGVDRNFDASVVLGKAEP